ncbi:glycerophosphodiester phosphodiesterase family protein [Auraticoccus monumenti]|uniref:Glycerophosphoryl diester phosphodiesterase n=1 Tax=Auraticoccus monumenti TaxID=675864 RepID=A0A1G7AKQ3_9ACTN|nr:glycerophosphodiester phosphodiesterase family protein [Auraticoccus monumenti]SDE15401.1 glycerophosphoryl diester phosphodiesterase [Auraticoccus monumenti]
MPIRVRSALVLTIATLTAAVLAAGPLPVAADAAGRDGALAGIDRIRTELHRHGPGADLLVAAHRGQWRDAPENSLAAIEAAVEDGAEVVEIDVRLTSDGVPVLMHDTSVNRTTDGSGAVSSLTLEQVRRLHLKEGLGGAAARVTEHPVPTLAEAMEVVRGRALVNLDKGWPFREEILQVLQQTGTVDHGLFKGSPDVAQAEAFMARDPEIEYMHVVDDGTWAQALQFSGRQPVAVEVIFDRATDAQAQPEYLSQLAGRGRVWINTMWESLAAGHTDETSLRRDPDLGWETVVQRYRASMIQTDNVEALVHWRDRGDIRFWDRQRGPRTVRVQAEEPRAGGEGVAYHDTDDNRCASVSPEQDRLDVCTLRGARSLGWIRGGEWVEYDVEVVVPGRYAVSARVSSPYDPAGTMVMTWDGEPGATLSVPNTTDHNALRRVAVEERWFDRGAHRLRIEMPSTEYQNFNIDYVQLDWLTRR